MDVFQKNLKGLIRDIDLISNRIIESDSPSQIELDILLQKLRDVYSHVITFDTSESYKPEELIEEETIAEEAIEETEEFIEDEPIEEEFIEEDEAIEDEVIVEPEESFEVAEEELEEEIEPEEELIEDELVEEDEAIEEDEAEEDEEPIEEEKPKTPSVLEYLNTRVSSKSVESFFGKERASRIREEEEEKKEEAVETPEPAVPNVEIEESAEAEVEETLEIEESAEVEEVVEPEEAFETEEELEIKTPQASTIGERFQPQGTLFETAGKTEPSSNDINNRFKQSGADLRTSIGVNEKFMFINDLFSGNLREYTEFVQTLNNAPSLDEAMGIIENTKDLRRWVSNSQSYTTLVDVIRRKFKK